MAGKDKRREQPNQAPGTGAGNKKDDAANNATTTTFDHSRPAALMAAAAAASSASSSRAGSHRSSLTDLSAADRRNSSSSCTPILSMTSPSKSGGGRIRLTSTSSDGSWSCVVCCQKVPSTSRKQLFAIGPCDHPVCAVCSTKMRVLCDQDECPICRQEITKVFHPLSLPQSIARLNSLPCLLCSISFLLLLFLSALC